MLPFRIIENHLLTIKVLTKMCRSKRRRIKNKWLKNPKNYHQELDSNFYIVNRENVIICHPMMAIRLRDLVGVMK